MRVKSDLADLQIELVDIRREGDELVVDSAPESSIDARIRIDASEARSILGRMLGSSAVWGFLIRLPFSRRIKAARLRQEQARALSSAPDTNADTSASVARDNPAWRARRESTGLNKPW